MKTFWFHTCRHAHLSHTDTHTQTHTHTRARANTRTHMRARTHAGRVNQNCGVLLVECCLCRDEKKKLVHREVNCFHIPHQILCIVWVHLVLWSSSSEDRNSSWSLSYHHGHVRDQNAGVFCANFGHLRQMFMRWIDARCPCFVCVLDTAKERMEQLRDGCFRPRCFNWQSGISELPCCCCHDHCCGQTTPLQICSCTPHQSIWYSWCDHGMQCGLDPDKRPCPAFRACVAFSPERTKNPHKMWRPTGFRSLLDPPTVVHKIVTNLTSFCTGASRLNGKRNTKQKSLHLACSLAHERSACDFYGTLAFLTGNSDCIFRIKTGPTCTWKLDNAQPHQLVTETPVNVHYSILEEEHTEILIRFCRAAFTLIKTACFLCGKKLSAWQWQTDLSLNKGKCSKILAALICPGQCWQGWQGFCNPLSENLCFNASSFGLCVVLIFLGRGRLRKCLVLVAWICLASDFSEHGHVSGWQGWYTRMHEFCRRAFTPSRTILFFFFEWEWTSISWNCIGFWMMQVFCLVLSWNGFNCMTDVLLQDFFICSCSALLWLGMFQSNIFLKKCVKVKSQAILVHWVTWGPNKSRRTLFSGTLL